MPTNVEIKAHVRDRRALLPTLTEIAEGAPEAIDQDDTFFECPSGRLKLRVFGPDHAVLIFYQRDNSAGPKESFYLHSETSDPEGLRSVLSAAYGSVGRVRKHRELFMVGATRVHVDSVEDLGDFLEVEVPIEGDTPDSAYESARHLVTQLGITEDDLVEGAYLDLILAQGS